MCVSVSAQLLPVKVVPVTEVTQPPGLGSVSRCVWSVEILSTMDYGLFRRDTTKLLLQIKSQCRYISVHHLLSLLIFLANFEHFNYIAFLTTIVTTALHIYISTILLNTSFPRYCNKSPNDVGPSFYPLHCTGLDGGWCGEESWAVWCCVVLHTIHRFHNMFSQSTYRGLMPV